MSRYKPTYLVPLLLCALAVAPPLWRARAQATPIKVSVPFDFFIAGETVLSGRYYISPALGATAQGLRIRSADGRLTRSITAARAERESPQRLRVAFNVYGDRHFLSEVFWPGSVSGFQLSKCKAELELEAASRGKGAAQLRRVVIGD